MMYEFDVDAGGKFESEAVVRISGADANVLEILGRIKVLLRQLAECNRDS